MMVQRINILQFSILHWTLDYDYNNNNIIFFPSYLILVLAELPARTIFWAWKW